MKLHLLKFVLLGLCLNVFSLGAQQGNVVQGGHGQESSNTGLRNYEDVIPKNTEIEQGLFTTLKVGDTYYFEIPVPLLGKEILVATKVSGHALPKGLGAGSQPRAQQIIRFQRKDNYLVMRWVTYQAVADKALPIHKSVKDNNFETVVYRFKIEGYGKERDSYIIKVNDFFSSNIPILSGWEDYEKKLYGISGVDGSRSYIEWMKAFPTNVEVRHVLTYRGSKLPDGRDDISLELNQSFILLPERPMVPRGYDERVGYFSVAHIDYGLGEQKAATAKYILRWRLEPSDRRAFERGELVAPIKPLVYYLDPSTPLHWRKYIKRGVEEWQKAFEKVGFKNAIVAKDAPTPIEDPDWFAEDIRYSVIRFGAKTGRGATGPNIHDPRTGEILQGNIIISYNIMDFLSKYFFVRTAATNPDARPIKLKEEVMGRLIQTVVTHEVGHTLGLMHNALAQRAYPIDSLRSPNFTKEKGTGESIMYYAFNYVAQPGDGVTHFFNELGAYDLWAIEYGYRPILHMEGPKKERHILNQWIREKEHKPAYQYSVEPSLLGEDQHMSAQLAVGNLKHIMENLVDWSVEEGSGHELLSDRFQEVIREYEMYMHTIRRDVGKQESNIGTSGQTDATFQRLSNKRQKKAVNLLNELLFETPYWLLNKEVLGLIGPNNGLNGFQNRILITLLKDSSKMILENDILSGSKGYTVIDLYMDIRKGVFKEVNEGKPIDPFRRNLQKTMVDQLGKLLKSEDNLIRNTDIPSIAMANLMSLSQEISAGIPRQTDTISIYHLQDLRARVEGYLRQN